MRNNTKIKILHLEDNPADADFIKDVLLEEGFDTEILIAENRYEFELAISSGRKFDLILSDYSIPAFDGFSAFRAIREKFPDIPFILISGETGEDHAIEAMKMGVTDYVLKHRTQRLGPAIRRALREYDERLEYKKAQEGLLLLNRAVEESKDGIFITDYARPENPIIFANKAFEHVTGYSFEEVKGKCCSFLYSDSNEINELKILQDAIQNKKACAVIFKTHKKNGVCAWNEIHLSPVKNQNGVVTNFTGIIIDVTEKLLSKQNILKFSVAVEQSPVSIFITDNNGILEYVNPRFEELTGFPSSEVMGKHYHIFNSGRLSDDMCEGLKRSTEEENIFQGEFKNVRRNGDEFWEFIKITPLRNQANEITHYLGMQEDITLRKKAEEDIIAAKEKAEEMNRLKTAFLSNMSHELRTPLIGIIGYSKILMDELTNPEYKEMLEVIHNSGNNLTETLNLILDFSKIESESVNIKLSDVDAQGVIAKVIINFEEEAAKKGLFLKPKIKNNLFVKSDEKILTKVLSHLTNNAIKYTWNGGVFISLETNEEDGHTSAVLKVKDTGIGIPRDNFLKIFEPFRQGSEGLNRDYQGLGLGLTLTKKFVELMGGKLTLENSSEQGSVFSITLPLVSEKRKKELRPRKNLTLHITEEKNEERYKVLVVEDDKTNMDIIEIFLRDFFDVTQVVNGEQAVACAKENIFDAVVMDIGLKGMTGVEATQLIKKIPGYEIVPVTAVTAYAMAGDKEQFLAAGCDSYLPKPFDKKTIIEHIFNCISESKKIPH